MDDAFLDVVQSIKKAIREQTGRGAPVAVTTARPSDRSGAEAVRRVTEAPRSSNLRTRRIFTEADKDAFLDSAFEYMAAFFETSLSELESRNGNLTSRYRRVDSNRFTAVVYRDGQTMSRCKVVLGGMFGKGISYSASDQASDNSFNENLSVEHGDQNLYLKPMGMPFGGAQREAHMTPEGASEYYWSMLMQPLQ